MAKLFGIGAHLFTDYLDLVVDNDWKEEGAMVIRETDHKGRDIDTIPENRRWQYKRGYTCFQNGDSLRSCGLDVKFPDSRSLWRKGWVQGLTEAVEDVGGTIHVHDRT